MSEDQTSFPDTDPMQKIADERRGPSHSAVPAVRGDMPDYIAPASPDLNQIMMVCAEKGLEGVEVLERIVALKEREADRAAARAFNEALHNFQAECPSIARTSTANIATRSGSRYSYKFADLDTIAKTVRPLLEKHGLSYSWDSKQDGNMLTCACTVRHVEGHAATSSFSAPVDSKAGMSEQQKHAAALTYAKRQSLTQVLGLTTADADTDAASGETISDKQVADLEALMVEVSANEGRFLEYLGVDVLSDLPVESYSAAVNALEAKRRKG
jgi:hypothetical protein